MDEIALGIQTASLATIGETWIHRHDSLLPQRSGEQKLSQVLGEYHDGFLVSLLLAERSKLGLDARIHQSLEGIFHRLCHEFGSLAIATHIALFQSICCLFLIAGDADTQESSSLATTHRQQTMG